jgi:thiol-disulfide isomerase/thioredoxin
MSEEATASTVDDAERPHGRVGVAVLVLAVAAGFALIPRLTRGCEATALDEDAPAFKGRVVANAEALATDGAPPPATLELAALKGHPVVLDFWATWCGPCQAESPIVNTIAQRYRDKGLVVVGVNTSDEDGLAAAFVKKKRLEFPMIYDEGSSIAKAYGVSSLPTLIVVSKAGKIVAVRRGVTSDSALDEIVRRYL